MRLYAVLFFLVCGILTLHAEDIQYRVKTGDTLSEISMRLTGTYKNYLTIAKHNNIVNPDYIFSGQVLFIPENITSEPVVEKIKVPGKTESKPQVVSKEAKKRPVLSEKNLQAISRNIMDKIEKMRDERRKHYLMRELIESKEDEVTKTVKEDEPVQLAFNVTETEILEEQEKTETRDFPEQQKESEYIIRLVNNGDTVVTEERTLNIKKKWAVGAGVNIQHKPSGDSISGLSRDESASFNVRYRFDDQQWIGFKGETWDETGSTNQMLEYTKCSLVYRYDFAVRRKDNWFVEGAIAHYDTEFSFNQAGVKTQLSDDTIGMDVAVGYEYFGGKNISGELAIRAQVAEAEFEAANGTVSERLNDLYACAGINFYF